MTVKVMTGEGLPKLDGKPDGSTEEMAAGGQALPLTEKPIVYTRPEDVYRYASASKRRRGKSSFGNILFVQLIISALFEFGIWAGRTFGGDEIGAICEGLAELFR